MAEMRIQRLSVGNRGYASALFSMMATVFEEESSKTGAAYIDTLLGREDIWIMAAFKNGELVGGLTAYTLPMTRHERSEIFIYDLAVHPDEQRKGVGRRLVGALRKAVAKQGIYDVFVAAEHEETHALDFYNAIGGEASDATFFTFSNK